MGGPPRTILGYSGYDVRDYDRRLSVEPERRFVEGTEDTRLVPMSVLRSFNLALVGLNVSAVGVDGVPARHDRTLNTNRHAPTRRPTSQNSREGDMAGGTPKIFRSPPLGQGRACGRALAQRLEGGG